MPDRETSHENPDASLAPLLATLAQACRILAAEGQADGTLGHVSLRDPAGRGFWIKRSEIGLDEVRDRDDLLLVDLTGRVLLGRGGLHSEWPIHAAPLIADPAVASVVHTHAPNASLLSSTGLGLSPLTSDAGYLAAHPVHVFRASSAHIDDPGSAAAMVAAMGAGPALLVRNHGLVTRGRSLEAATLAAIFLERAAGVQLRAAMLGVPAEPASPAEVAGRAAMLRQDAFVRQTFLYHARRADRAV